MGEAEDREAYLNEFFDQRRTLRLAQPKAPPYEPGQVSHYHEFSCYVCHRTVPETEYNGWNVAFYPTKLDALASTGLVCSKECVMELAKGLPEF